MYLELINQAKELKCSTILIDNLEISGLEEDAIALDEHIRDMEDYLARERARFDFVDYLAISEDAARVVVNANY